MFGIADLSSTIRQFRYSPGGLTPSQPSSSLPGPCPTASVRAPRFAVTSLERCVSKILVGLKRVIDYNVRVRVKPDGTGIVTDGVKMSINPFDEIALEEALRIREKGDATEVIVVSIGPADTQQQLRLGLAMGADRAILVQSDTAVEPLAAARAFLKLIEREQPQIVLLGKQGIDDDN